MSRFIAVPFGYGSDAELDEEYNRIYGTDLGFYGTKIVRKYVDAGGRESVYTVSAPCGAIGSAMHDPPSLARLGPDAIGGVPTGPNCFLMYAPPIIIGDTYMSVMDGFNHINMVHRTSGYSMPVPTNASLNNVLGGIG